MSIGQVLYVQFKVQAPEQNKEALKWMVLAHSSQAQSLGRLHPLRTSY